jgi:hypothetical protein
MAAPVSVGRLRRRDPIHPRWSRGRLSIRWQLQRRHHRPRRATVDQRPHIDLVELWEADGRRVPIVDVEQAIRQACRRWRVLEIAADPFRWARSLQLLDGEGLPVLEYPQSPGRMTPATARSYEAVVNGQLTHSGDSRLARHVGNAVLREDSRGARLAKERKDSRRRIDAARDSIYI